MSDDLTVIVTDSAGNTKTIDSDAPDPKDRPRGIQFSTQIQSGFYTGGFTLARPIDHDNIDISLGDDVRFILANGDTVYEGFVQAMPRSVDGTTHTLSVTTAGWMAHASDRPFTEIFVDRDAGAWQPMSRTRRAGLLGSAINPADPNVAADPTNGLMSVNLEVREPTATQQICEALYDAGPNLAVAAIYYNVDRYAVSAPWEIRLYVGASAENYNDPSANLAGTGGTSATYTPTTPRRFAHLQLDSHGATDALAHVAMWRTIAVYGDHGLPLVGDAPSGVAASDVIRYVAGLYCPLLSTAGVQDTTYPISHLVFKDDTTPYDAFLKVNSYHLWKLAVWEDRTLYFDQIDLTDWDWEIRHDEAGNQIGLQGDDLAGLRNGIVVQFTNAATGSVERLYPADNNELRDDSLDNPYTQHGRAVYGSPYIVPFPTTAANALELGRLQLLEDNQPKAPGSFTVQDQIKDRAGNWQPVAKVRAGDRIRLTSSINLSDRPRLIQETSYSHDGRSMTIAVDSTLRYLEGFIDRTTTALTAAGLAG